MKKVLLILFVAFVHLLNAQTFTEDFESVSQGCNSDANFNEGCVDGWIATHGTANIVNEYDDDNQFINTYSRMSATNTSCGNGFVRNEGIALEYDFLPGVSYTFTFRAKVKDIIPRLFNVSLANILTNDISSNGMDCPPYAGSTVDVIQLDGNTPGFGTEWQEYSVVIPALDKCYTQLWLDQNCLEERMNSRWMMWKFHLLKVIYFLLSSYGIQETYALIG